MDVILSEAKNLACEGQMFRLRLNMTATQIICDRTIGVVGFFIVVRGIEGAVASDL